MPQKIAAGNWKMNGMVTDLAELSAMDQAAPDGCVTVLCLPATMIAAASAAMTQISWGGQDCHANQSGAHTGDISADMLANAGATYVIVGHSERRTDHGESDGDVLAKAQAAQAAGLTPIVCVGETLAEREAGSTLQVVADQLTGSLPDGDFVIAYEPVWAIGTGLTPTIDQIAEVHDAIRAQVDNKDVSILYGGSVKPANAEGIFAIENVNGGLVGGASLKSADFIPIMQALASS